MRPPARLRFCLALALCLVAAPFALAAPTTPAGAAPCDDKNLLAGLKPHVSFDVKGDVALITDGTIAAEGASWDAPVGVILESPTAAVTYDLGAPRQVSALFVQADANDTYKISASLDGAPASYKPIVEVANVIDAKGHGLRNRAIELPTTTVRYLRFGEGSGDGFFSLAELSAYCKKPTPFPPQMKLSTAPAVPAAEPGAGSGKPPPGDGGGSAMLLTGAALGLAWLAYRAVKRASIRAGAPEGPSGGTTPPAGGGTPPASSPASDEGGEGGGGAGTSGTGSSGTGSSGTGSSGTGSSGSSGAAGPGGGG